MFKTLTAALVAASVLIAPIASTANAAQPATKPAATAPVKMVKKTTRHAVKHHKRTKFAQHARHFKKHAFKTRHGKIVKAHKRGHVIAKVKTPTRAN